jgi:hypothetical protein
MKFLRHLALFFLFALFLFFVFNAVADIISANLSEIDGPTWEELQDE